MARSRNIKPGFFENEDLADCGPYAMLLFAGMWTLADREGRLEDRPRRIKAQVLPYFDVDIDQLLNDLAARGFIERYEVAGERYVHILNFGKHQNPHVKEAPSTIPAPCKHETNPVQEPEKYEESPADSGFLVTDSSLLIPDTGFPEPENDAPAAPVPLPKYSQVFEVFWREYPSGHGGKVKTYEAWKAKGLDRASAVEERNAVMAGLHAWKSCERWAVKGMVKAAETWVKERRWEDEPPPADNPRASPNGRAPTLMDELSAYDPTSQPSIEARWRPS